MERRRELDANQLDESQTVPTDGHLDVGVLGLACAEGRPALHSQAESPRPSGRVTTTNILNLRAEPNAAGAVLDLVAYETTLTATERLNDWIRVVYGSGQGWLNVGFLQLDGDCG